MWFNKVDAIKVLRQSTPELGLKDAKYTVENSLPKSPIGDIVVDENTDKVDYTRYVYFIPWFRVPIKQEHLDCGIENSPYSNAVCQAINQVAKYVKLEENGTQVYIRNGGPGLVYDLNEFAQSYLNLWTEGFTMAPAVLEFDNIDGIISLKKE